jgi:glycolate oxidase iron-sulfur subunit
LVKSGQVFRALLPGTLQSKLPRNVYPAKPRPMTLRERQVLMLEGCVQPSLSPNTNAAAARVLDRLGISVIASREAGCCGAVDYHLDAQAAGLDRPRLNIDVVAGHRKRRRSDCADCQRLRLSLRPSARQRPGLCRQKKGQRAGRDLVEVLRDEPLENLASLPTRISITPALQHGQLGGPWKHC